MQAILHNLKDLNTNGFQIKNFKQRSLNEKEVP